MVIRLKPIISWISLFFLFFPKYGKTQRILFQNTSDCRNGLTDTVHQYFDLSQLRCIDCSQPRAFQTVNANGLRCICQSGYRLTTSLGGASIECTPCPANQVTSLSGWECVECSPGNVYNPSTRTCQSCLGSANTVERQRNGAWPVTPPLRQCESCVINTKRNPFFNRCERCNQILSVIPTQSDCSCPPAQQQGGLCFASATNLKADISQLYSINYGPDLTIESAYFRDNIRAAEAACNIHRNLTSCQLLGNMCVLLEYTRNNVGNSGNNQDACSLYLMLANGRSGSNNNPNWPEGMPWLYYPAGESALEVEDITTQFTFPSSTLNFFVATYTLNGTFLGISQVRNGLIQLCKNSESILNAAYTFGTTYSQSCDISIQNFWDQAQYPSHFYDLYLEYESGGSRFLYPIPVLLNNYRDNSGTPNQDSDRTNWQLTRRFFLVENIVGRTATTATVPGANPSSPTTTVRTVAERATYIRYAESMRLFINLRPPVQDINGRIFPPYLQINYRVVNVADYNQNPRVPASFSVEYSMDLSNYQRDFNIAVAVLALLGTIIAFVQTYSWNKRSGRFAIDFITLTKFVLIFCSNLANAIFIVLIGSSIWWLLLYKRQNSVVLIIPTPAQETTFIGYLAAAFVLKLFSMIDLLVTQCMTDIFILDWERSQASSAGDSKRGQAEENSVSIWRTYFIANEWNELQSQRRTNGILQLFLVLLFLSVIGFENMATSDPSSSLIRTEGVYRSAYSRILRFSISSSVYILIGVAQWLFFSLLYERFFDDPAQQFVDLCSMCNISIFLLDSNQHGYYIHGRSVHGRADTGIREMYANMKREEENLCGQRGLLPNSDQQTFEILIPRRLRLQYDKILIPAIPSNNVSKAGGGRSTPRMMGPGASLSNTTYNIDPNVEMSVTAYATINKLMQKFIDHSLSGIEYTVKDKTLIENILDIEFHDLTLSGAFFNDNGHSFDNLLFIGQEFSILTFEILLFVIIDLASSNFILSTILTYIIMKLLTIMRASLGRSNLAKKTLVDKRFLI